MDRGYFLELGRITKDEQVYMESRDDGNPAMQAEVWRFDPEAMKAVYGQMNANPITLTNWTDTSLM